MITLSFDQEILESHYQATHLLSGAPTLQDGDLTLLMSGAICESYSPNTTKAHLVASLTIGIGPSGCNGFIMHQTIAVHAANLTQQHLVLTDSELRLPIIDKLARIRSEKSLKQSLGRSKIMVTY